MIASLHSSLVPCQWHWCCECDWNAHLLLAVLSLSAVKKLRTHSLWLHCIGEMVETTQLLSIHFCFLQLWRQLVPCPRIRVQPWIPILTVSGRVTDCWAIPQQADRCCSWSCACDSVYTFIVYLTRNNICTRRYHSSFNKYVVIADNVKRLSS